MLTTIVCCLYSVVVCLLYFHCVTSAVVLYLFLVGVVGIDGNRGAGWGVLGGVVSSYGVVFCVAAEVMSHTFR